MTNYCKVLNILENFIKILAQEEEQLFKLIEE